MPFDEVLSLAAVQGVQGASDDKGLALQTVRVARRLVLQQCPLCCVRPQTQGGQGLMHKGLSIHKAFSVQDGNSVDG